jgi:hypothetical protein
MTPQRGLQSGEQIQALLAQGRPIAAEAVSRPPLLFHCGKNPTPFAVL